VRKWINVFPFESATSVLFFSRQGCQMVHFLTKNPNLDKFWRALELKMLVYFMAVYSHLFYIIVMLL
jgi:hypothetical protein